MTFQVTRTFDILERALTLFPRKDALGGKNHKDWYTYSTAEYVNFSNQLALGLLARGYVRGDKIATVTTNRPEWNFADMALAMTGIVHVPIYPTISEEEYTYILKHSEVKAIFVGDNHLDSLVSLKSREELIGEIIGLLQSPAKNVVSALQSGGNKLAGIVKTLQERG